MALDEETTAPSTGRIAEFVLLQPPRSNKRQRFCLFQELQGKIRIPEWKMINWGTAVNIYWKIQWHSCKNEMINCDF